MSRLTVILSPRAIKEIDEAALWWAERGKPTFIDDAVAAVLARLDSLPESAPCVQSRGRWTTTRRASVAGGYQLFYRYDARTGTILVRCFWHERRRPPRL